MNNESAVDFPGNYRVHIGLSVSNLEASRHFYQILLGCPPTKERPGYVKFEPADPSVNLTLNQVPGKVPIEGGPAHFGVQVKSVAEVRAAVERFQAAGLQTLTEEGTSCCYAVQDKVWTTDPDGRKWEVFVVLQADVSNNDGAKAGCCAPQVAVVQISDLPAASGI